MTTDTPATEQALALEFQFPPAKDAYKPSGKTTPVAVVLMVAVASIGAAALAAVMVLADQIISAIGAFAFALGEFPGLVLIAVSFVAYVAVGFTLGRYLGRGMSWGGRVGKNRSPLVGTVIAVVASAGAMYLFYRFRSNAVGAEAFDSAIDWVKFALYGVGAIAGTALIGHDRPYDDKFCEACQTYMDKAACAVVSVDREADLMEAVTAGQFDQLGALTGPTGPTSRCRVHLAYCPSCQEVGVVDVFTHLVRRTVDDDGNEKVSQASQHTFSGVVDGPAIAHLRTLADRGVTVPAVETRPSNLDTDLVEAMPDLPDAVRVPTTPVTRPAPMATVICWTCDSRPADTSTMVGMVCPPGQGHAGDIDRLRSAGYLRDKSIVVPRCRACLGSERRIAVSGQVSAWVGIPLGIGVAIPIGFLAGTAWPAVVVGFVVFVVFAFLVMRRASRAVPKDANTREVLEHPAVLAAKQAGWTGGSTPLIPKFGPPPTGLAELQTATADSAAT